MPWSLGVLLCELALDAVVSGSLELFVLVGFVLGELAGEADTGDLLGC